MQTFLLQSRKLLRWTFSLIGIISKPLVQNQAIHWRQSLKPQPLDSVCLLNCYRTEFSQPYSLSALPRVPAFHRDVSTKFNQNTKKNILKDYLISMIMTTVSYKYPQLRLKILHVSININVFLKYSHFSSSSNLNILPVIN